MATYPLEPALFSDLLKDAFARHQLHDMPVGDRSSHFFRIDHSGTITHRIYVSREFFGDHSDDEVKRRFRDGSVADQSAKRDCRKSQRTTRRDPAAAPADAGRRAADRLAWKRGPT